MNRTNARPGASKAPLLVIGIVLLGIGGFLIFNNSAKNAKIEAQTKAFDAAQSIRQLITRDLNKQPDRFNRIATSVPPVPDNPEIQPELIVEGTVPDQTTLDELRKRIDSVIAGSELKTLKVNFTVTVKAPPPPQ